MDYARKSELRKQAILQLALEHQVTPNPHYKTLFYGLKKNHPHNVAVVYPILYILRRVVFAIVVINLLYIPFLAIIILMTTVLFTISYLLNETQWEESSINLQHFINEIALYLVLCHFMIFCGLSITTSTANLLSWSLIGLLLITIVINIAFLLFSAIRFIKLYFKRCKNRLLTNTINSRSQNKIKMMN